MKSQPLANNYYYCVIALTEELVPKGGLSLMRTPQLFEIKMIGFFGLLLVNEIWVGSSHYLISWHICGISCGNREGKDDKFIRLLPSTIFAHSLLNPFFDRVYIHGEDGAPGLQHLPEFWQTTATRYDLGETDLALLF